MSNTNEIMINEVNEVAEAAEVVVAEVVRPNKGGKIAAGIAVVVLAGVGIARAIAKPVSNKIKAHKRRNELIDQLIAEHFATTEDYADEDVSEN